jgi:hypothetical protein
VPPISTPKPSVSNTAERENSENIA